jgi:hypothetical protein
MLPRLRESSFQPINDNLAEKKARAKYEISKILYNVRIETSCDIWSSLSQDCKATAAVIYSETSRRRQTK